MTNARDPLHVIASPPPQIAADEVGRIVNEQYGLDGELAALISERDQNLRLTTRDAHRFVVKIANAAEDPLIADFQIQAMLHMQKNGCRVAVPHIIPSRSGEAATTITGTQGRHIMRVVSYLPGRRFEDIAPDMDIARQLGVCVADIGVALREFEHPGDEQPLLWDMQRAAELRNLVPHITDRSLRAAICDCLDDFETYAAPRFATLRRQVIHNDLNPGNVLVSMDTPLRIAGVIDFGDMIRAPLIVDLAVAAAYLRSDEDDATSLLASCVAGYDAVTQLEDVELELLYDLVRTRLATSITILHWRLAARAEDDAYAVESMQGGESAAQFLKRIDAIPRNEFASRLRQQCDR